MKRFLNQRRRSAPPAGFTIVELMIATAVFSVILLVVTAGVLSFTHQYYKGVTRNQTQNTTQTATTQISQDLQFSNYFNDTNIHPNAAGIGSFCIGSDVYSFRLGGEVEPIADSTKNQFTHGLVVFSGSNCTNPASPEAAANNPGARELLAPNMRLASVSITPNGTRTAFQVSLQVIYGDSDLLVPTVTPLTAPGAWAHENCINQTGTEFCAEAQLTTTVTQRLQSID